MNHVIEQIRRVALARNVAELTDAQLVERFLREGDKLAAAALVRRHGPLVWGVCRRILPDEHDAEDAFQATFLVLLRKAATVRPASMLANWLHGVAHRTALKTRAMMARRRSREKQINPMPEPEAVNESKLWSDLEPLLEGALARLPEKYRIAVLLCDLEGKTRKEAARQLNIPEGTLSSRLTTARALLAKRLSRQGVSLSSGLLAAILAQKASADVPVPLTTLTIQTLTTGAATAPVCHLAGGVVRAMLLSKLRNTTAVITMLGTIALGLSSYRALARSDLPDEPVAPQSQSQADPNAGAKTGPPQYCWLVFGPKGKTHVLLRLRGNEIAIDRNGDRKFDGKGERFASEKDVKDVAITDPASKTTYVITKLHVMHVVPPAKFLDIRVHPRGRSYALWSEVMLTPDMKGASELHFGGPFKVDTNGSRIVNRARYLLENSVVNLGFLVPQVIADLAGKGMVDDSSLPRSLQRGQPNRIFVVLRAHSENADVCIGSPDDMDGNTPPFPKNVHPSVDVRFPGNAATSPPIKKRFPLVFARGCFFRADVSVPREAGAGTARMTFSFDAWKDGKVAPTTVEVPVEPAD